MKMMLLCAASMLAVSPALAQNTFPTQAAGVRAGGQVMMLCDAGGVNCRPVTSASPMPIDAGSGAGSAQTQGTAANGGTPTGNPNVVAGSDGTNVRTILTASNGAIRLGVNATQNGSGGNNSADGLVTANTLGIDMRSSLYVFGGGGLDRVRAAGAADATGGQGLLGAGILGQYQTTLPTYTAGQFGTLAMTGQGVLIAATRAGGGVVLNDGVSNSVGLPLDQSNAVVNQRTFPLMFNGTTFDRVRGDTTGGLYTQERERSQFFQDLNGALAAGASGSPIVTRDGGASPSQWGTFSCFARSDQASATSGFAMQASNDNVNFVQVMTSQVAANTPTRITDRNDFRYHRCLFVNGATAATLVTMTSSFGN